MEYYFSSRVLHGDVPVLKHIPIITSMVHAIGKYPLLQYEEFESWSLFYLGMYAYFGVLVQKR